MNFNHIRQQKQQKLAMITLMLIVVKQFHVPINNIAKSLSFFIIGVAYYRFF